LVGSGPCFTLPAQCRSISQLLAGIHSDPGGSPEPPGSLGLRKPDPRAPHLIPPARRLAMTPLNG
jgi:hypothetical protein